LAEGGEGREARTGNALWTLLVGAVLLLMELIVLAALVPADWSAQVRESELAWLRSGLGEHPAALVVARAERWYEGLFAETGLVAGSYRITLPTQDDTRRSGALAPLATLPLWAWVAERLGVIWAGVYQVLQRVALVLAWWPLLVLLLAAAWGEGVLRRRIRQAGFAYASPLVHAYALRGLAMVLLLTAFVLLLPVPLPALGVPVVGMLLAVLLAVAVANAQKRV
jgi:hypothetical protein